MRRSRNFNILAIFSISFSMIFSSSHYFAYALQNQDPKIYFPVIFKNYPFEVDAPSCRWTNFSIAYKWGTNLQTPGTSWRTAFEAAVVDWNVVPTKFYFYYSSSGNVTFNTYSRLDTFSGYSVPYCNGNVTTGYDVYGNTYYSQTTNGYHSVGGHEAGHSQGIGHVADKSVIALMGYNPDHEIYYTPQQTDIDFVNTLYP